MNIDELEINVEPTEDLDIEMGTEVVTSTNYNDLVNKPIVNDVMLQGSLSLDDLGIQASEEGKGLSTNDYTDAEKTKLSGIEDGAEVNEIDSISVNGSIQTITNKNVDITVPTDDSELTNGAGYITKDVNNLTNYTKTSDLSVVATTGDYNDLLNKKTKVSQLDNDTGFITNTVNNLANYTLKTATGSLIDLSINTTNYVVTLDLKDTDGNIISTDSIDLPLESVVVSGRYDNTTKEVILTLENGSEVKFSVADLVAGLQTEITSSNKLSSDLVDDTNAGNKFVTTSEKETWNAKGTYSKPANGIPKTDLDSDVQTSLGKADTALQEHQDLSGYIKKNDSAVQTISLTSGTGTTALSLKSMSSTSSYLSFSNPSGWLASYGVTSDKKPIFYNGTGYILATTNDIPTDNNQLTNGAGYITGINSSDVTTALGYTPYNSTNPSGYQTASDVSTALGNETKWAWYGTCSTGASTRAKVVTCTGFKLTTGAVLFVKFTNSQTYNGSPTLNVNSTGAITVQYKGGTSGIRYMWSSGEIVGFVYDGTYWVAIQKALATSTYYGMTKLSTSGTSTSDALALTPSALYNIMSNIVAGLPVYSSSSTYSVGDRVRYGTSWYECNTNITEAEDWDAEHWTKIDNLLTLTDSKVNKTAFDYDDSSETLTISIS